MDGLHELLSDREDWRKEEVEMKENLIKAREEVDELKAELGGLRREVGLMQQRQAGSVDAFFLLSSSFVLPGVQADIDPS
jgi:chromosome segregation ATPase